MEGQIYYNEIKLAHHSCEPIMRLKTMRLTATTRALANRPRLRRSFLCVFLLSAVGCTTGNSQEVEKSNSDATAETSDDSPGHTNELANETSPYLLMHAHNPVNWRAWNEETLAKAKAENKPIFLSIGYSSCHWCHVMERESFLDKEIAEYLNKHFICIKVDREERPDVDEIYMESLNTWNRMTGSRRGGGWPLSMFLLPDGRPFFGGTYFPARTGDRGKSVGFLTVIQKINEFLPRIAIESKKMQR